MRAFMLATRPRRVTSVAGDGTELLDLRVRAAEVVRGGLNEHANPQLFQPRHDVARIESMTTRSGLYAEIASTFGVYPERLVCGALFG